MQATNAVVLVVDRLGAGWLGPYGNAWLETPNFNRLAAQSVVCETVIAESPDLAATYRAYWSGRHALEPSSTTSSSLSLHVSGDSVLLTDDRRVAEHPLAAAFGERRVFDAASAVNSAPSIEQTGLFAFFDAARTALSTKNGPGVVWLHSRGMSGLWDAPLELRYQFADEQDPDPPDFVEPPEAMLAERSDPDELLGLAQAYAGQVSLADLCLGILLDALDEHPLAQETMLVVTSPRGYPLGEHRRVGACDEALYGELLHVPLVLRFPACGHALVRSQQIVQPHELFSMVAETCGWYAADAAYRSRLLPELRGEMAGASGVACCVGSGQRAIRTPAWFLRESMAEDGPRRELFAKPDDRWEANEVSSRCGEAVELLATELERFAAAASQGQLSESPPLAGLLSEIWR
jgi:arylsulfatase A-like enzyme